MEEQNCLHGIGLCKDLRCDECPFRYSIDVCNEAHMDDYVAKPEHIIDFTGWPDHPAPKPEPKPLHTCPHGNADGTPCSHCYWEPGIMKDYVYCAEKQPKQQVWDEKPREGALVEGMDWSEMPSGSHGELDEHDVALFVTDSMLNPYHYARWEEEPIQFIARNDLPWWLANVIKYVMRYDAKDGLKDLYKAKSYLEMKIRQLEGEERFWVKPVAEERQKNDAAARTARTR